MKDDLEIKPIFVFSLPRSGSTLMQRILGSSTEISTVSEPWILLPLFYALKKEGVYAEYGHDVLVDAVEDLCDWGKKGQWNLHASKIDLFKGVDNLIDAYVANKDNVLSVHYESLIDTSSNEWQRVFDYLGIPFKRVYIEKFSTLKLNGRLGDPTGVKEYQALSMNTKEKWKKELSNPIRKYWCKRYLKFIGRERLLIMGYSYETLIKDLDKTETTFKYFFSDCVGLLYGFFYSYLQFSMVFKEIKKIRCKVKVYGYH